MKEQSLHESENVYNLALNILENYYLIFWIVASLPDQMGTYFPALFQVGQTNCK